MAYQDIPVQCCRCKNKHMESERVYVASAKFKGASESVCPRCNARSYFDMRPMVAYCWASGLIELGETVPEGAIKLAEGPKANLKVVMDGLARHGQGRSDGTLLVPGVPEAADQHAAGDALRQFIEWAKKCKSTRKYGVVFNTMEVM